MGRPRLTAAISAARAEQASKRIDVPMPRLKKPTVEAAPPEPVRRQKLGPTLPVLQPMIDRIRHPYNKPKNGPAMADHIVALLDAVARALEADGLTLSVTRLVLTARQGQNRIDVRIVERSKRVSRRGEPFSLEPTGFLYVTTDNRMAWPNGSRFERFVWEEGPGISAKDLAKKVIADLPKLFEAQHRR